MNKNWFESKAALAGLGLVVLGIGRAVANAAIDVNDIFYVLTGFGLLGLRTASEKG
jgi:hypothetical protein